MSALRLCTPADARWGVGLIEIAVSSPPRSAPTLALHRIQRVADHCVLFVGVRPTGSRCVA